MLVQPIPEPIVVTGASGFIGRRLIHRLVQDGYRPRALLLPADRLPSGPAWASTIVVVGDVTQLGAVRAALERAKTVFHLAALVSDWGTEQEQQHVPVGGTKNVIKRCQQEGARGLLTSSLTVYGHKVGQKLCSESEPHGRACGPYGRAKSTRLRRS